MFLVLVALTIPHLCLAQTYSRISPNSDLYCVYLPNGKTQIASEKNDTYRIMSFRKATKSRAKQLSRERQKAKKINQLIKKLEKQRDSGEINFKLKPKEFKAVKKFYLDGELGGDVPESISENIARLENIRATFYSNINFETELIKLIKRCKKREIPSPGTFETIFYNITTSPYNAEKDLSGSGYVLVLAIVPAYIANSHSYLCYDHPRQGVRYKQATTDPCLAAGVSNGFTEDCKDIAERDANGVPQFYLAALEKQNFFFQNRPGGRNFEDAAKAAETNLRTNEIYGWSNSVTYAVVSNVDECSSSLFEE